MYKLHCLMNVQGFDWDIGNKEKCQNHGLSLAEIESVFHGDLKVMINTKHLSYEERYHGVGKTKQGRYVFIVFTFRSGQSGILIRPISARFMHQKEIDHYENQTKP